MKVRQTISRGSIILLLAFGSVFGVIALYPFVPDFESLTKEEAYVQKVWKDSFPTTTTSLQTISGRDVKCMHSKTGGCDPETMKLILAKEKPVIVWHDGESVYQLSAQDQMILPYEHFHNGRGFSGAISVISFLIALVQIAIRKGVIGVASTQNDRERNIET